MSANHASSIEDVYRRRHGSFRAALGTIVGSVEAADDVVQESFAKALASRAQFRGDGPLEAWIWRIAIRTALERNATQVDLPLEAALDPQFIEPERDPALAAAIRKLPGRRRFIVFLRYFGDLSYSDIAQICGIAEGTVAATLAQARTLLADELGYTGEVSRTSSGGMK